MNNLIIAQSSKSLDFFQQELEQNSQRSSIFVQFQLIKLQALKYLDLLVDHLQNYRHYVHIFIKISKNVLIGDEGYKKLTQSLKILVNASILHLHIEESCHVESSGMLHLTKAIKNLKQLSDLSIMIEGYNYIQNEGLQYLGAIFEELPNLSKLQILIGQQNRYYKTGFIFFCEKLKSIKQFEILLLDIDGRKTNENGLIVFAKTLEHFQNLQVLHLSMLLGQFQIGKSIKLATALGSLINLKELNFLFLIKAILVRKFKQSSAII